MSIKTKLTKAFAQLRKEGLFARQSFWCCQSCACCDIPEGKDYVFYTKQDAKDLRNSGSCYLSYGTHDDNEERCLKNAKRIIEVLNQNGILTHWSGSVNERIYIKTKQI